FSPGNIFWIHMDNQYNANFGAIDGASDTVDWYVQAGSSLAHQIARNVGIQPIACSGSEPNPDPAFPWSYTPDGQTCSLANVDPAGYYGLDVYHLGGLGMIDEGDSTLAVLSNNPVATAPHRALPLMSYMYPRWTSPYTYCQLLNVYGIVCDLCTIEPQSPLCQIRHTQPTFRDLMTHKLAAQSVSPHTPNVSPHILGSDGTTQGLVIVGGTMSDGVRLGDEFNTAPDVVFRDIYWLTNPDSAYLTKATALRQDNLRADSTAVAYELALIVTNESGEERQLDSLPLNLRTVDGGSSSTMFFFGALSFVDSTIDQNSEVRLEMRQVQTSPLLSMPIAVHELMGTPPTVQFESLMSSQGAILDSTPISLTAGTTIRWLGQDEDGDALRYTLLYSHDDGTHWTPLMADSAQSRYQIAETDLLPSSASGKLRVLVHDGVHVAEDETPSMFMRENANPSAFVLLSGPSGEIVSEIRANVTEEIILRGLGVDIEDGTLPDEQLVWSSTRDGHLGIGRELAVRLDSLGNHLISLIVTDSNGNQGHASITAIVDSGASTSTSSDSIYLPFVQK
ncbi:MAG: hypothetical protein AAF639_45140, partial [Chloroflexota bacterium]